MDGANLRRCVGATFKKTLVFAMSLRAAAGCAARGPVPGSGRVGPPIARARYVTVHMDTLASGKEAQFETARREWLRVLDASHVSDDRGFFIQVRDSAYFALRPLESL